jgi:hypothetical protein
MSVHDLQLLNQASFAGTWDIITSIKLVPAPQPWKYFDPLIIRRKRPRAFTREERGRNLPPTGGTYCVASSNEPLQKSNSS